MENRYKNTQNINLLKKPVYKTDEQKRRNRVPRLCNLLPLQENTTKKLASKEVQVKKNHKENSSKDVFRNTNNKCYCKKFTNTAFKGKDDNYIEKLKDDARHSCSTDSQDSELDTITKYLAKSTDEPRCVFCGLKLKEKRSRICDVSLCTEINENTENLCDSNKSDNNQVCNKFNTMNDVKNQSKDDQYEKWFLEVAEYRRTHWSDCHYIGKIE